MFGFEVNIRIDGADKCFLTVDCFDDDGKTVSECELGFNVLNSERDRFQRDGILPICSVDGEKIWFNKKGFAHRLDGPALETPHFAHSYFIDGVELTKDEWEIKTQRRLYFLREKIITLKKLLEIPELYGKVYYAQKTRFMALLNKI